MSSTISMGSSLPTAYARIRSSGCWRKWMPMVSTSPARQRWRRRYTTSNGRRRCCAREGGFRGCPRREGLATAEFTPPLLPPAPTPALPRCGKLCCAVKSGFCRRPVSLYSSVSRLFIPIVMAGTTKFRERERERERFVYRPALRSFSFSFSSLSHFERNTMCEKSSETAILPFRTRI